MSTENTDIKIIETEITIDVIAATKLITLEHKSNIKKITKLEKDLKKMTENFDKISTEFKEYKTTIKAIK
jgi:hypothetical protein